MSSSLDDGGGKKYVSASPDQRKVNREVETEWSS
jgi:hypothetical protein